MNSPYEKTTKIRDTWTRTNRSTRPQQPTPSRPSLLIVGAVVTVVAFYYLSKKHPEIVSFVRK